LVETGSSHASRSSGLHVHVRSALADGAAGGGRVVLVHGSMDRGSSFRRLAARLRDFTVVWYDRRGYGESAAVPISARFGDQVDDLINVAEGPPCIAVGHSFGGDLVLAAAERRPDLIETAVVFEAPMPWVAWWPRENASATATAVTAALAPEDKAEAFMRRVLGDDLWERMPAATRRQRRSEGAALVADMESLGGQPPPFDPALIAVPVIAAFGTASTAYHQETMRRLALMLPKGELVALDGAGHGAHLSRPADLAAVVRTALRRRPD
jgi:pimeloyl-ACP methyl ester carboxylesterase